MSELQTFKSSVEDLALEELSRLEEDRLALTARLDSVRAEIRSVRAVLVATQPPKKQKKVLKKANDFTMSAEREAEITAWLTGHEGDITSNTVRQAFPSWSGSYVNMTLKMLREIGTIRLSATSGGANVYRTLV